MTERASWPEIVGDNMVLDPGMDTGTPWHVPTGVTFLGGKQVWASVADGAAATNDGTPPEAFLTSGRYLVGGDISGYLGGNVAFAIGDVTGTSYGGNGTNLSEVLDGIDDLTNGFRILNTSGGLMQGLSLDNVFVRSFQGMGQEASWAFTGGGVFWQGGSGNPEGITFDGAPPGEKAELTGGSKTAFDAAVSTNTACSVTLHSLAAFALAGTVQVKLRGGTGVDFTFVGDPDETVTHTVPSGPGSGCELITGSDGPGGLIALIRITLA